MPLTYAAALEAFSLVVTVDALIVLAADINGRAVTSADGMAIIVLCVAAAVQGFRVISLTRLAGPTMIRDLDDAMLLFSGVYLVSIWATLHIGINIMAPSRKVFILVRVSAYIGFACAAVNSFLTRDDDHAPSEDEEDYIEMATSDLPPA